LILHLVDAGLHCAGECSAGSGALAPADIPLVETWYSRALLEVTMGAACTMIEATIKAIPNLATRNRDLNSTKNSEA
jgi:hypothetical protein